MKYQSTLDQADAIFHKDKKKVKQNIDDDMFGHLDKKDPNADSKAVSNKLANEFFKKLGLNSE